MRFMKDPDGNGSPETAISSTVVAALREIVGGNRVLDDPVSLRTYGVDRTTLWSPAPSLVVLPGTTAEVQAIVRLANRHGIPIVPSGGRTGLSGGAVAEKGELVVAMDRMNRILDFSPIDRTVTVEAGVVTQRLQDFAREQGLYYPVDFAAAGSSQIGGNIATNAGGIKVIRYGMTRDWVAGLKVVDGNGNVLELNRGLVKNNSGLDFRHLFIGSEGTLGIITEATLGLARAPAERSVMVLGVAHLAGILEVLHAFDGVIELSAFEFFSHNGLLKVLSHGGLAPPFQGEAPYYALLEFEHRAVERAMELFERCAAAKWVSDGVLSQNLAQARSLWRLREDMSETLARWKPYKNDLCVRVSRMPEFLRRVDALVAAGYPGFELVWYGHIGDGNLHLNILKPDELAEDAFGAGCARVSEELAALVKDFGGSISAEHGVGLLKKPFLLSTRSATEVGLMRQVKKVFDPAGIMNPGKIFDPD